MSIYSYFMMFGYLCVVYEELSNKNDDLYSNQIALNIKSGAGPVILLIDLVWFFQILWYYYR